MKNTMNPKGRVKGTWGHGSPRWGPVARGPGLHPSQLLQRQVQPVAPSDFIPFSLRTRFQGTVVSRPRRVPSSVTEGHSVLFPDVSLYGWLCLSFSTSALLFNKIGPNEAEPVPREAHSSLFDPCLTSELPCDTGWVLVWLSPLVCTLTFL